MKLKKSPKELKDDLKAKRQEKIIKKQEEKKMKKRKLKKVWISPQFLYTRNLPPKSGRFFLWVQEKGNIRKKTEAGQDNTK